MRKKTIGPTPLQIKAEAAISEMDRVSIHTLSKKLGVTLYKSCELLMYLHQKKIIKTSIADVAIM